MLHLKTDPIGIDSVVDRIQRAIEPELKTKWNGVDVYPRVYKKRGPEGVSLERYLGNGEYQKILYNEGNKIFFVQGSKPVNNVGFFENDLWLVCVLNIENVKNIEHRADEEMHFDLITELSSVLEPERIKGLEYGMNNLKRVVEDVFEVGNFKFSDIHPYHVFMVKMRVEYYLAESKLC